MGTATTTENVAITVPDLGTRDRRSIFIAVLPGKSLSLVCSRRFAHRFGVGILYERVDILTEIYGAQAQ